MGTGFKNIFMIRSIFRSPEFLILSHLYPEWCFLDIPEFIWIYFRRLKEFKFLQDCPVKILFSCQITGEDSFFLSNHHSNRFSRPISWHTFRHCLTTGITFIKLTVRTINYDTFRPLALTFFSDFSCLFFEFQLGRKILVFTVK